MSLKWDASPNQALTGDILRGSFLSSKAKPLASRRQVRLFIGGKTQMRNSMTRRQVFIRWSIALTAFWVFMNWPTTFGIGNFWATSGFPLPYAWGTFGRFQNFDALAFALDFSLGMGVMFGIPWLCAWSRRDSGTESC